jgi:hypothetical protein
MIRDLVDDLDGRELSDAPQVVEEHWGRAKAKHTNYGEIMATRPVVEMLIAIYPLKQYYGGTKLFQPYSLTKQVVGTSGAVR